MSRCINYKGWNIWPLENKWIRLRIAPQLGGRMIQLEMDGYEFFFVNPLLAGKEPDYTCLGENGAWLNFGGEKIWPAPQGWNSLDQWPGPPDPMLDSGQYSVFFDDKNGKEMKLISPFNQHNGLQITKEVSVSETRSEVKMLATFKNASNVVKRWSVWPVLQMDTSGEKTGQYQIICPLNLKSIFSHGYKIMHGLVNNPQYRTDDGKLIVDYQYLVGKVGLDAGFGWVAFVDKEYGKVFVLMFNPQTDGIYPDDTSVQIWTSGRGIIYSRNTIREFKDNKKQNPAYMEMELLSPLQKIQPEGEIQFEYRMLVSTIKAKESIINVNEFGIISSQLSICLKADGFLASAKYGVFLEGILKILLSGTSGMESPLCLYETKVSPLNGINVELLLEENWFSESEAVLSTAIFDLESHFIGEIEKIRITQ